MNRNVTTCAFLLLLAPLLGCNPLQPNGDADVDAGMKRFEKREFSEAIPHFESALEKGVSIYTRSEVLTIIGNCYNELDQYEKSLDYHVRAIDADPNNYKAYVNKGIVHRLMNDYDQAEAMYAKALQLKPDYAELHASMGALAIFQQDDDKAIKHLERAVQLDDSLAVAHSNLAMAYATVGRFQEADAHVKKAVVRGYHDPEALRDRIEKLRTLAGNPGK